MIFKLGDKTICIATSPKAGITSIWNMISWNLAPRVTGLGASKKALREAGTAIHTQNNLSSLKHIAINNLKVDHMFAVIRDPIQRFFSAYIDRVEKKQRDRGQRHFDKSSNKHRVKYNLVEKDIYYVIDNLDVLTRAKFCDFGKHSRPQVDLIGHDPSIYEQVFWTDDIYLGLKDKLKEVTGVDIPKLNSPLNETGSGKISKREHRDNYNLYENEINYIKKIKEFYHEDYSFINRIEDAQVRSS